MRLNPEPLASNLLRSRVGRRHQPQTCHGLLRRDLETLDLFRDPEIQQPDGSVGSHENVGRLQVAMNYGVAVRILHGLTHLAKQLKTALDGALVLGAVLREWQTLHVLHDEEGRAVGKCVGVVNPCNRGMIELCQGTLLGAETLPASRREPGVTEEFESNQTSEILALGKIEHTHSALAEHLADAVGS